jgi:hypothetical protein
MALVFPTAPLLGELFPVDPGTSGTTQYQWDGAKWNAVISTVSLGTANQGAFNAYQWPATDGTAGYQLTTDGAGNLRWEVTSNPSLQVLSVLEPFDGVLKVFTLLEAGSLVPFTPTPPENIVVFLGGVPQVPTASYTISGNNISFTEAPLLGTTFYAISSTVS